MNIFIRYNKIRKYESYWRDDKDEMEYDDNDKLLPFPVEKSHLPDWEGKKEFLESLSQVEKLLTRYKKFSRQYESKNCHLCDATNILDKIYHIFEFYWEDSLSHYVKVHNIKPSRRFIKLITHLEETIDPNTQKTSLLVRTRRGKRVSLKINGTTYIRHAQKYLKVTQNQLKIMDALMNSGGYQKTYQGKKGEKNYKYSEHGGMLDFDDNGLERIIVTARSVSDSGDNEIYFPSHSNDTFDFEYMFHTHPPTPYPGGRTIRDGVLYEFPSSFDIMTFIEVFNEGKIQGSIVMAPEGMYIIFPYHVKYPKKIKQPKDEIATEKLRVEIQEKFFEIQEKAIEDYRLENKKNIKGYLNNNFYSLIAQNKKYINLFNKFLHTHYVHIAYIPRKKINNNWLVTDVYLPVQSIETV